LADDDYTHASLTRLSMLGIGIVLDDFGTGYSSLSYLNKFPIDTIKIDRSFISDIETSKTSQQLVETIIIMAKNLGLNTVAEGIENENQYQFLMDKGCNMIQGYLLDKPMKLEEFLNVEK
jgi:EAL domain-containing protein (putative c-di-GMP-specific phosphodiesterase class I)